MRLDMMTQLTNFLAVSALALMAIVTAKDATAETLLTVRHGDEVIEFDREDLEMMGVVTIETETIWTEGAQTFTGVPLVELIEELEHTSGAILASAINDYTVEIPVSDAIEGGPIIAYLNNGEAMSIRDKGPLWIVYPYDSNPDYQAEVIYSRSIWQLDRIELSD